MSGLYFRGKLAYATRFGPTPAALRSSPPTAAWSPPRPRWVPEDLRGFGALDIHPDEPRYREPLQRDVARLAADPEEELVLLGSLATGKYLDVLLDVVGERLLFPTEFLGPRGHEPGRADAACRAGWSGARLRAGQRDAQRRPVAGKPRDLVNGDEITICSGTRVMHSAQRRSRYVHLSSTRKGGQWRLTIPGIKRMPGGARTTPAGRMPPAATMRNSVPHTSTDSSPAGITWADLERCGIRPADRLGSLRGPWRSRIHLGEGQGCGQGRLEQGHGPKMLDADRMSATRK